MALYYMGQKPSAAALRGIDASGRGGMGLAGRGCESAVVGWVLGAWTAWSVVCWLHGYVVNTQFGNRL